MNKSTTDKAAEPVPAPACGLTLKQRAELLADLLLEVVYPELTRALHERRAQEPPDGGHDE